MRILICTSETGNAAGGLALHCAQLKDIFEELGHEVFVEVLLNSDTYFAIDGGYDKNLGRKLRTSHKVSNIIKTYDSIDLCVSCGAGRTAFLASLFCKSYNIPLYVVLCGSEINLSFDDANAAFYNVESLKHASAIIGLSKELNDNARLLNTNHNTKYYVIPNICDPDCSCNRRSEPFNREFISYASGATFLGEKKGIANLIKAFSILVNELGRKDKLFLYGRIDDDIKAQYMQLIADNKLGDNVILCGYLERESFHAKMSSIDAYIQASPFEGYGNSVAEAIMSGKDIIISNTGYIAESIADDYSEHIMRSLNPNDMANSLLNFALNVFPKHENISIREKLSSELSKEAILSAWSDVLLPSTKSSGSSANNCRAVMFHDVDSLYSGIDYSIEGFEEFVSKATRNGYRLCSAREFFNADNTSSLIICTFDDAYENVYKNAYPILKKQGFTATVFVCPDLIGQPNEWNHKDEINRMHMTHDMLKTLVNDGWEVGSHGMNHINLLRLSEHELDDSLCESQSLLKEYGPIDVFCYPYGMYNSFILGKVKKYYNNAFSVTIGGTNYKDNPYQITRLTPEEIIESLGW